jgi:nitrite reductase/ring-hydroxylating ferredoxin subunit
VRHVVATVGEIPPGGRKIVTVERRSIGVFNVGGSFFALRNRCPHQGGPLCEGRLVPRLEADLPGEFRQGPEPDILTCPWHGWEFDVRTGRSWCDPDGLRAGRYEAEIVDVSVEEPYVVVHVRS